MQEGTTIKRVVYAAGTLIFIASVGFLAFFVYQNRSALGAIRLQNPNFLLISITAYAISHLSTGLSWPLALRGLGASLSLWQGLIIGLVAQIGKYLPGNVAHYFGRATLAAGAGITIKTTGISTAIEILAAVVAAAFVAGAAILIDPTSNGHLALSLVDASKFSLLTAAVLAVIAVGTAVYMHRHSVGLMAIIAPTACLATSFLLSGVSFAALLHGFGLEQLNISATIAVFAVAWLAGFLIPGAPAGLGVREAVLIGFIAPLIGPGDAIACTLLHRALTSLVDALAAVIGYAAWTRSKKKKSANEVLSGSPTSQG